MILNGPVLTHFNDLINMLWKGGLKLFYRLFCMERIFLAEMTPNCFESSNYAGYLTQIRRSRKYGVVVY